MTPKIHDRKAREINRQDDAAREGSAKGEVVASPQLLANISFLGKAMKKKRKPTRFLIIGAADALSSIATPKRKKRRKSKGKARK